MSVQIRLLSAVMHSQHFLSLSLSYLDTDVLGAPDPSPASLASLSPPVVHEKARHPLARSVDYTNSKSQVNLEVVFPGKVPVSPNSFPRGSLHTSCKT